MLFATASEPQASVCGPVNSHLKLRKIPLGGLGKLQED